MVCQLTLCVLSLQYAAILRNQRSSFVKAGKPPLSAADILQKPRKLRAASGWLAGRDSGAGADTGRLVSRCLSPLGQGGGLRLNRQAADGPLFGADTDIEKNTAQLARALFLFGQFSVIEGNGQRFFGDSLKTQMDFWT